jgi:hypothetical protein
MIIIVTLALLLTATTVLAKAERIVLSGTEHMFITGGPAQVWEANGWVHQRGVPLTGTFDFGAMQGTETQLANARFDPLTGSGRVWGTVTYIDTATGITCSGIREGKLTNFLLTAKVVAHCSDGSRLQGTLQDIVINFPPGSPVPSDVISEFNGEWFIP